jgi:hypothetical protein
MFRPERTRISYHAALDTATPVAFIKESRTRIANATKPKIPGGRSGEICGFFSVLTNPLQPLRYVVLP